MDEDEGEEEKVPTGPHTILGDLSTAAAMVAEEIFAHSPPRADTAAPQMICWISAINRDTVVDVIRCAAVSVALHHEISPEFATQVMSPHDAILFCIVPVNHNSVVLSSLLSLVALSGKHTGCTSWRVDACHGVPVQTNAFDCGPFARLFLKHLLHGIDMRFKHQWFAKEKPGERRQRTGSPTQCGNAYPDMTEFCVSGSKGVQFGTGPYRECYPLAAENLPFTTVTSLAPEVVDILPPPPTDHSMLIAELSASERDDPHQVLSCLLDELGAHAMETICKLFDKDGDKERLTYWWLIEGESVFPWKRRKAYSQLMVHLSTILSRRLQFKRQDALTAISWLDISSAFDTVSHQVQFSLLDCYGLIG
ncbi:hypothetical protein T01_4082 [Trichinella spiralis]|uniref:Ubiquitin-like protease family profile domain-containing protein n=1 Tax=Trichinella spiralis TaxID=6334 RepID=A0A0V1B9E9_TRISP|nr:hypothetical protein T01_4082 [Trichinella spiralis]